MRDLLLLTSALIILMVGCSATNNKIHGNGIMSRIMIDTIDVSMYNFVNVAADTIIDPLGSMSHFLEKLVKLGQIDNDSLPQKINILHYGDSHIQGAIFPDVVMRRMQCVFGNAGRGLLVPHRITRSNEATDYKITTPNNWSTARLIDIKADNSVGIGGVGIKSNDPHQRFVIQMLYNNQVDTTNYAFNRIVVFHDSLAPMITAREELLSDISTSDTYYDFTTEIDLTDPTDSIMLYTFKQDKFNSGEFYGFSLENGRNGILYHTMGINGARYANWASKGEVIRQSKALSPDLIIISMGSNEAVGYNFDENVFYAEIDSFVKRLRATNPSAAILLTTPAEAMRMSKRAANPNPNFVKIQNTILRYGREKNVAVFDLYAATGAVGSSRYWVAQQLMQRDRIHYTVDGYKLQGLLLYGAIINAYKQRLNIK